MTHPIIKCICGLDSKLGKSSFFANNGYDTYICNCGVEIMAGYSNLFLTKRTKSGVIHQQNLVSLQCTIILDESHSSDTVCEVPKHLQENIFLSNYDFVPLEKYLKTYNLLK
jgi:hypothetical protein